MRLELSLQSTIESPHRKKVRVFFCFQFSCRLAKLFDFWSTNYRAAHFKKPWNTFKQVSTPLTSRYGIWWNFWSDFLREKKALRQVFDGFTLSSGHLVELLKQFSTRKKAVHQVVWIYPPDFGRTFKAIFYEKKSCTSIF